MFGRKRKVDLEEIVRELSSDDEVPTRGRVSRSEGDVKLRIEIGDMDALIKELRMLRESIDTLIEELRSEDVKRDNSKRA